MGTCRFCGQNAGFLRRKHGPCRNLHTAGIQEMTQLASAHTFNEAALRQTLGAIAQRSRATGEDIDRALEEGFRQSPAQAMSDGILTRQEEERLRTFRDNLAVEDSSADSKTLATLDRASSDRLIMEARLAAISVHDGDQHLQDLSAAIRQAEPQGYEPTITAGQYELMKPPANETTTPRATYQVEKKLRTEGTATKAKRPKEGRGHPGRERCASPSRNLPT